MRSRNSLMESYKELNTVAHRGGTVLFGSTFTAKLHMEELAQNYAMERHMYNRSIEGLSVFEATDYLDVCLSELSPSEIFVNLGEHDLEFTSHTLEEVMAQYEWVLYKMHTRAKEAKIHILSVCSDHPNTKELNQAIAKLAKSAGCYFVDMDPAIGAEHPAIRAFGILRSVLFTNHFRIDDAMVMTPDFI